MKLVSVIMSIYNEPVEYIEQAVRSILDQTYSPVEFIIVIDNPAYEEAVQYVKSVSESEPRVKLIVNGKNVGLAMSMNIGLKAAEGFYIARMDADDVSLPDRFRKEIDYLEANGLDAVGCAVRKIDGEGKTIGEIHPPAKTPEEIERFIEYKNPLVHPTVIMKKDAVEKLGGYRNFSTCQDYDLWARFVTSGYRIGQIDEILFCFRRHGGSITATRRYSQVVSETYLRSLLRERRESGGADSYSDENLAGFREKMGEFDPAVVNRENKLLVDYNLGVQALREHKFFTGLRLLVPTFRSGIVRDMVKTTFRVRLLK